jgi:pectate lyase
MIDHVSARWWDNKGFITYTNTSTPIKNTTLQWSLMYESNAAHPVGPMTDDGMGLAHLETDQDFHHNLFANIGHRLPLFNTKSLHWVNNIVYNWDYFASQTQGGTESDFIGNIYKAGPLNGSAFAHELEFDTLQSSDSPVNDMPGPPSVYVFGNIGPNQSNPSGNQWVMTAPVASEGGSETGSPIPASWQRSTPLPKQVFPIAADPAQNLNSILLPTVGNSQRLDCMGNWVVKRDSPDARVISEYQAGNSGAFFTVDDAAHVIPSIDPGTACQDTDHDGMPDAYEIAHGLNPNDPSDAQKDSGNGYTWLERYLNGPDGISTLNIAPGNSAWAGVPLPAISDTFERGERSASWNAWHLVDGRSALRSASSGLLNQQKPTFRWREGKRRVQASSCSRRQSALPVSGAPVSSGS